MDTPLTCLAVMSPVFSLISAEPVAPSATTIPVKLRSIRSSAVIPPVDFIALSPDFCSIPVIPSSTVSPSLMVPVVPRMRADYRAVSKRSKIARSRTVDLLCCRTTFSLFCSLTPSADQTSCLLTGAFSSSFMVTATFVL